jgi:hypothetical protein
MDGCWEKRKSSFANATADRSGKAETNQTGRFNREIQNTRTKPGGVTADERRWTQMKTGGDFLTE